MCWLHTPKSREKGGCEEETFVTRLPGSFSTLIAFETEPNIHDSKILLSLFYSFI